MENPTSTQQKIIEQEGNVLVIANPGTGKTFLLAHKYAHLIKKGISPEHILCLSFTEKAKKEMESRIIKVLKEQVIPFDISKLNVFTFHSYALNNINEDEILNSNLLRYAILKYIKDNRILNYSDEYLINTIIPRVENLIRYLKSFGIMPDKADISEAKKFIEGGKDYTKEEIYKFADYFIDIFKHYEEIKNKKGVDYADLLIKFTSLKNPPLFDYVLVDELQDVNAMEADIALKSRKMDGNFFAVGDKKQAIFGFQGGSILNFDKFKNSTKFTLYENFRSTNEILNYAKNYFISKTNDLAHKEELKDLCNSECKTGQMPVIYEVSRDKIYSAACELATNLDGNTAIITRTNHQVILVAKELDARGINFNSTFSSSSDYVKTYIINFLKGMLSSDVQDIKNAMFTPFFPCSLRDACNMSSAKSIEEVYEKIPDFKDIREKIKTVEDVNVLFRERIVPVCISYGDAYLSAGIIMQNAYQEAISVIDDKNINSLMSYMLSADLVSISSDDSNTVEKGEKCEKSIILTTIHKAKGKEFENVVYIPSKTKNNDNFMDNIVAGILKSKGINVKEELEEEALRLDFVALTRAKNKLFIVADKINDYKNDYIGCIGVDVDGAAHSSNLNENVKRAFNLFVNKMFDEAKALLDSKDNWIKDFVENHFRSLEYVSYSSLEKNAYDYFVSEIIKLKDATPSASLGSEVHDAAARILSKREYSVSKNADPYIKNVLKLIYEIKNEKGYSEIVKPELRMDLPMSLLGFDSPLKFKCIVDAVFKKGNDYLMVDWKTDKDTKNGSNHRQQLEIYKRIFSHKQGVPIDNIKVAIGYVGLRDIINTEHIDYKLDEKQPASSAFDTISEKVNRLLSWIKNYEEFFKVFIEEKNNADDPLWRSVVEEYRK